MLLSSQVSWSSLLYFKGFRPEWCISTIYHAWDAPFWSGTFSQTIDKKLTCHEKCQYDLTKTYMSLQRMTGISSVIGNKCMWWFRLSLFHTRSVDFVFSSSSPTAVFFLSFHRQKLIPRCFMKPAFGQIEAKMCERRVGPQCWGRFGNKRYMFCVVWLRWWDLWKGYVHTKYTVPSVCFCCCYNCRCNIWI